MKLPEAIRELKSYIHDKRYIERKQEEIELLTEQINKVTATYSDMPKVAGGNSKEDLIAKKIDLDQELLKYLKEMLEKKQKIEQAIRSIDQPYKNMLEFRYIEGMELTEISVIENYSYRQCTRILNKAHKIYAENRENEYGFHV